MFKLETKYCYLLLAIFLAFILNVYIQNYQKGLQK